MKTNWNKAVFVGVIACAIIAWLVWSSKTRRAPLPAPPPSPLPAAIIQTNTSSVAEKRFQVPRNPGFLERASEFTEDERKEFTNLFATKLKPAAEKWFLIYSNRVPFNLADLKPDKLVNRMGRDSKFYHSYTFVIGDITFVIQEQYGATKVAYLASRSALRAQITMPTTGVLPDLSMPVNKEQVTEMVEADSGMRFPQDEVTLTPTGESGSFMGGVDAEVGKEVNNPLYTEFKGTNYSFVFGPGGKLVYYLRSEIATPAKSPVKTW